MKKVVIVLALIALLVVPLVSAGFYEHFMEQFTGRVTWGFLANLGFGGSSQTYVPPAASTPPASSDTGTQLIVTDIDQQQGQIQSIAMDDDVGDATSGIQAGQQIDGQMDAGQAITNRLNFQQGASLTLKPGVKGFVTSTFMQNGKQMAKTKFQFLGLQVGDEVKIDTDTLYVKEVTNQQIVFSRTPLDTQTAGIAKTLQQGVVTDGQTDRAMGISRQTQVVKQVKQTKGGFFSNVFSRLGFV